MAQLNSHFICSCPKARRTNSAGGLSVVSAQSYLRLRPWLVAKARAWQQCGAQILRRPLIRSPLKCHHLQRSLIPPLQTPHTRANKSVPDWARFM